MIKIILINIFILCISIVNAQNSNPIRIEISEKKVDEAYALPLKNKTLLILTHNEKRTSKGEQWNLAIYNSIFFKTGNKELLLPRNFILFNYKLIEDSIVYLAFTEYDGDNASLMLYRLNLNTNTIKHTYITGDKKARLLSIEYLKDKIYIIGDRMERLQNQLKDVSISNKIRIVAPVFPIHTSIIASYSNIKSNKVIVMTNIYKGDAKGLYYNELNGSDNTMISNQLHDADNIGLVDGSIIESKGDALLFMGTYSYSKIRDPNNEKIERVGTYFAKIIDGQFAFFKTNKFSEFTNIFSTLNYREQQKAKQSIQNGKNIDLHFKLLIHKNAIKQNGLYVLTAEMYFPEYHYENSFDSRGYMYQTQVFDGYRTDNCVVVAYNDKGRLLWDNYMHIEDVRSYQLKENVLTFAEEDSSIVMAYYSDGKIKSKLVKGNEVVYKKSEDRIETVINETIITDKDGLIQHWYDNYFILSGYQVLIGKNSKKRKVYYFNMISFE